ncbi:MAG: DUF4372 domain-containing protein, partial [Paludibacteraceae bacterium]|nr:DUF4372 domain-containing protein [Paludibacteraceae bacterium]
MVDGCFDESKFKLLLSAKSLKKKKIRADSIKGFSPFRLFLYLQNNQITMSKNSIFFGQPIYGQFIKSLDRDKIVEISRKHGGERYVKSFDGFTHLATMLYAVIMKKNLRYEVLVDCMSQNPKGETEHREQVVVFRKDGINHIARIVT